MIHTSKLLLLASDCRLYIASTKALFLSLQNRHAVH